MSHTPGPWRIFTVEDEGVPAGVYSDHGPICTVSRGRDARLIAAAPDLLLTLDSISTGWHMVVGHRGEVDACEVPACHAARAAVAKATGPA